MSRSARLFAMLIVASLLNPVQAFAVDPFRKAIQRLFGEEPEAPAVAVEVVDFAVHGGGSNWGPEQATGPPDTPRPGDQSTAWASLTEDGQEEWLELTYEDAVVPTQVIIHENFNPGAVTAVSAMLDDEEKVIWEGKDPTPVGAASGVSKIPIKTDLTTNRIRIYISSEDVAGWNEIDAVGLVGKKTPLQWATAATASSTYADLVAGRQQAMLVVNDADAATQLRQREKQMAKLLKRLRDKEEALEAAKEKIKKLQAELDRLQSARETP